MKKSYFALAVLAMAALASCQENEISNEIYSLEKGEVLIRVGNGVQTKSADTQSTVKGATIELGADETGTSFVLEETITNLDNLSFAPQTKGTPGYTENFAELYKGFNAAVYKDGSVYEEDGAFEEYNKQELIYKRKYPNDIWDGTGNPNLYFFLRTPASYIDDKITNLSYSTSNGSISFSYTSPTTADEQQDMLFTSRPLNTVSDFNNLFIKDDKGLPVLFHHALTGVKFAIGNEEKDKVTITKVEFTGLKTAGSCVITPKQEDNKYEDNPTSYSSATAVVWTPGTATAPISQEYNSVTNYAQQGTGVSKFAENYYQGGNMKNLSKDEDDTAAQTFWLIPQQLNDNVKLIVSYSIDGVAQKPWEIDFGTALKKNGNFINWLPGELRTYTIKVDEVNVKIEDTVTIGDDQKTTYTDDHDDVHQIYGGTKSGIKITNTGNTDAFIRVAITGQWVDENNAPVFSFTDFTDEDDIIKEIDSWYNDQFGTGNGKFGVFDGLVGYTKNGKTGTGNTGWVKGNDGYYYYTTKVASNAQTGTAPFSSYTVTLANVPRIKVAGALQEVHFEMEISTQAISAKKLDGSDYTWDDAWERALDYDPSATN